MEALNIKGIVLIVCSILFFIVLPSTFREGRIPYSIVLLLIGLFMLISGILLLIGKIK